jgi:hypothetical protein
MWVKVRRLMRSLLASTTSKLKQNPTVSLKPTLRRSPTPGAKEPLDVQTLESQTGFP